MKLYHDPFSAPARAVRCFMLDEGMTFEEQVIDLMSGDHFGEGYDAVNPNRQVPVLVDGEFHLTESAAILKYLADKFHSSAYPQGLRARARVNETMDWFNTGFLFNFVYCLVYTSILPDFTSMNAISRADIEHMGAVKSRKYLDVLDRHMLACVGTRSPLPTITAQRSPIWARLLILILRAIPMSPPGLPACQIVRVGSHLLRPSTVLSPQCVWNRNA